MVGNRSPATLADFLLEHPTDAKIICSKIVEAARAAEAAQRRTHATQGRLDGLGSARQTADCRKAIRPSRLFIIVGATARAVRPRQGRDRKFQAIPAARQDP